MTETAARRLFAAVLLLAVVLIFYNLGSGSLDDDNESRTAERAREILLFDDWLTIHWNYQPDFVKPPLYYWLTALTYSVIGVNELSARLWSAFFGLLGFYAVYRFGTLLFSAQVGAAAAAVFLTIPHFIEHARAALLDTGLLSVGLLGLCALLSNALLSGWMLLGVGFMLKGPWVFFYLLAAFLWCLMQRRWEVIKNPRLYLGMGLFLIIVLPWHMTQYYLHGQSFLDAYFGHEIIERIRHPLLGPQYGEFYYFMRVADRWHVWTGWVLIGHVVVGWREKEGRALAFLDLWILAVLATLTFLIHTKSRKYAMVVYPALAVIVGYFILYAVEHLRWGAHLLALSMIIALGSLLYHYNPSLDFNSEMKAMGQAVQRSTADSQSLLAYRPVGVEPVIVFYSRRPVYFIWSPEALAQTVQNDAFVVLKKDDLPLSGLQQHGFLMRTVYESATLILIAVHRR